MKIKILPFLLCLMVQQFSYFKCYGFILDDLFIEDAFNGNDLFVLDSTINYKYNTSRLKFDNNTKDVMTYNAFGLVSEEINYVWDSLRSIYLLNEKTLYSYNDNHELTDRYVYTYNSATSDWVEKYYYHNLYNSLRLRTESIRQDWNNTSKTRTNAVRYTYAYNSTGLLVMRTQFKWNKSNGSWINQELYEYTNSSKDLRLSLDISTWQTNNWIKSELYIYSYNSANQLIQRFHSNIINGINEKDERTDYYYDQNGLDNYYSESRWDGTRYVLENKKQYYWSKFNNAPTQIALYDTTVPLNIINKNQFIAKLKTIDIDDHAFTYSFTLHPNLGKLDNDLFYIKGDSIFAQQSFQSIKKNYSVYIQTVDPKGGCLARQLNIYIYALNYSYHVTDVSCHGQSNGTISGTAENGFPPYEYLWNNGANYASITQLKSGIYEITIVDAKGVKYIKAIELKEPDSINITPTIIHQSKWNTSNGSIHVDVAGGTEPYSYKWSNGSSTNEINLLKPGEYILTLTDFNNCVVTAKYKIDSIKCSAFKLQSKIKDVQCFGDCDGSIEIQNVIGARYPLQFVWDKNIAGDKVSNLCSGNYLVSVIDDFNCQTSFTIVISEPKPLIFQSISIQNPIQNNNNGSINIVISGGSSTYVVDWKGPENFHSTNFEILNLKAGCYTATVIDNHNCSIDTTICLTGLTGTDKIKENLISIFPNPTHNNLYIKCADVRQIQYVKLHDIYGHEFFPELKREENLFIINLIDIPKGCYIISSQENIALGKFVRS